MPLLVVVHDTRRNARECAAAFAGFAERHHCAVAAPLFPAADARHPGRDNYKLLAAGPVRFDLALLGIVAEIGRRYPVEAGRFALHGFSGGAQFAHRFFYLHPGRLIAVSVAGPDHPAGFHPAVVGGRGRLRRAVRPAGPGGGPAGRGRADPGRRGRHRSGAGG